MGESMCENLIEKSGKLVYIYDMDPIKIEKMVRIGGIPSKNIAELAQHSNIIFIMVPKNEHVQAVINELIPYIDHTKIIVDMSTISPRVSRELAEKIKAKGGEMLDAPVVKSKAAAISGELGILVGGNYDVLQKIMPFLLMMGKEVTYMGKNGNGLILKLIHNMLVANIQNGVNEALIMAETLGLDFNETLKGLRSGGAQNFYLDSKAESIKSGDYSTKFSVENMYKDVLLHKELQSELGLDLPGADLVRAIYNEAYKDFPHEDFSATIKIVKKRQQRGI